MASTHSTSALPSMAAPGYGKRSAPGQSPRRARDFAQLPSREAAVAAYIDRLPDGAAMDVKTLARDLPLYGQQAVRTALNRLSAAGHLRRVRERVGADGTQWVFRTYFSRAARADAWWAAFLAGDVPDEAATVPAAEPVAGYDVLAGAGRVDPRMSLSARECEELAPLAAQWLAWGATEGEVVRALTDGLPPQVHRPGPFARRRLTDKLPPVRPPAPPAAPPHRLLECTDCGAPGRPEALPGGLCRRCRTDPAAEPPTRPYAPRPRAAIRTRERNTV